MCIDVYTYRKREKVRKTLREEAEELVMADYE